MNTARNLETQGTDPHPTRESDLFSVIGNSLPARTAAIDHSELPAPGEYVVVRCPGFQCLAYRDSDGRWRDARSKARLNEVSEIIMRF